MSTEELQRLWYIFAIIVSFLGIISFLIEFYFKAKSRNKPNKSRTRRKSGKKV